MRRLLSCAALLFALSAAPAHATLLIPIEFRELVNVSSVIVHGRVVDVRPAWGDGRRSIETWLTVDVTEYMKGSLGATLTVRVPGGQIGRYRTVFVGAPAFHDGDEVVLFLRSFNGRISIVGLSQGAFRVLSDGTRTMVTTPVIMTKPGDAAAPVTRGDAARRPLPLDTFRDLVRRVVSERGAQ